jgi:hypothetical protein
MNPSTFINTSTKLMLEAQCMDLFDQTSPKLIGQAFTKLKKKIENGIFIAHIFVFKKFIFPF